MAINNLCASEWQGKVRMIFTLFAKKRVIDATLTSESVLHSI